MKPVVGIICEYDPFHKGHQRQFQLIREALPGARIVCLMSGCFTQRGFPALFSPSFRADIALKMGADLVLELPTAYSVRDAEHFALAGVEILSRLGFVTHLSFGCESDMNSLQQAAELMENPTDVYLSILREHLSRGVSFAAAQGKALSACIGISGVFDKPNNILGLCYLRALIRTKSRLIPLPVRRVGDYHAEERQEFPSSTRIRSLFLSGRRAEAEEECGYSLESIPFCPPNSLDLLLFHQIRSSGNEALAALPDCSEGLHLRLKQCAMKTTTGEELRAAVKTKRYAYSRISRLCAHALLGITEDFLRQNAVPTYVRILGIRMPSELTPLIGNAVLPVISKAADGDFTDAVYNLDRMAYDLWALGAGLPAGLMCRSSVRIHSGESSEES